MSAEANAGQPSEISHLPRRATRLQRSDAADLAVTTEAANRAGREIWGYNKFVAGIDVKCDVKKFSASLHDPHNALIACWRAGAALSFQRRRPTSTRSACLGAA
jgi:hypothetical protein